MERQQCFAYRSSSFTVVLQFIHRKQLLIMQQLSKRFYDKLIPESLSVTSAKLQSDLMIFQLPSNEIISVVKSDIVTKKSRVVCKFEVPIISINSVVQLCGDTYIFTDGSTHSKHSAQILKVLKNSQTSSIPSGLMVLAELNQGLSQYSVMALKCLSQFLVLGGNDGEYWLKDEAFLISLKGNVSYIPSLKYKRMGCSLVKFCDTSSSTRVHIYACGGTKTMNYYIERLTLTMNEGVWRIPNTWDIIQLSQTPTFMHFKFNEGILPIDSEDSKQKLLVFGGCRKLMRTNGVYMLTFDDHQSTTMEATEMNDCDQIIGPVKIIERRQDFAYFIGCEMKLFQIDMKTQLITLFPKA